MKNLLKKFTMLFLALTIIYSCSDDFLEPERNTAALTDEDLEGPNIFPGALSEGLLNGIYNYMIQRFGARPGAGRHYDFGHKGLDIWTDLLSGDMALSVNTYGWYSGTSNLIFTQDFSRDENTIAWNYLYRVISQANAIIGSWGENADISTLTPTQKEVYGQAKALRAYGYFYLTQLFQREYMPSQEILPFYTSDINDTNFGKVPASQIYSLIVSDLNDAIVALDGFSRIRKNQINRNVARGLLAYTYAAMGMNLESKNLCLDIINSGEFQLTTAGQLAHPGTGSGFNDVNTQSWMWGFELTADLDVNLVSWWGQMDLFSYSYAAVGDNKAMDVSLFAQFPVNDVRRSQFLNNPSSARHLQPWNKFFSPARVVFGQNPMVTDYIYMRVDEFYLLGAETAAKSGDETTARNLLKLLLPSRLGGQVAADAYVDPLSGAGLLSAIDLQTRLELWGEGKTYFAMKRNQRTMQRGSNHAFQPGISVPHNDTRLTFQIPQSEMDNNPNITSQN